MTCPTCGSPCTGHTPTHDGDTGFCIPVYAAQQIAPESWLRNEQAPWSWFVKAHVYAMTQTLAIPALSKCTPEELYHAVSQILRGAGVSELEITAKDLMGTVFPPLRWSREVPTVEGWYVCRLHHVERDGSDYVMSSDVEYYSPSRWKKFDEMRFGRTEEWWRDFLGPLPDYPPPDDD